MNQVLRCFLDRRGNSIPFHPHLLRECRHAVVQESPELHESRVQPSLYRLGQYHISAHSLRTDRGSGRPKRRLLDLSEASG